MKSSDLDFRRSFTTDAFERGGQLQLHTRRRDVWRVTAHNDAGVTPFGMNGVALVKTTVGSDLVAASASISLDWLGVGFSLPALGISLVPLQSMVAITTVVFTLAGLAFGAELGLRFRTGAERAAGTVLVLLGIAFAAQHVVALAAFSRCGGNGERSHVAR